MKVAVYTGTRNLYSDMLPALNSLLVHSDVDKIYLLIEDDTFPFPLPPEVECINISHQTYFRADGPNFNSSWTYMVLIRAALSKIFPQYDTILSLDVDTIVNENISDLWNIDISNNYLAAAYEPIKSTNDFTYINMGVVLFNLKKIRADGIDNKIIYALNNKFYEYNEQDCISELCQGYITKLDSRYNVCNYTEKATHRSIIHFAAIKNWNTWPLVNKYRSIEIKRNLSDKIGLDIIIPTYKNISALKVTLDSIKNSIWPPCDIKVTVVDDASNLDYNEIIQQYPFIKLIIAEKNGGPGIARQLGLNNTQQPYIMFIDTGDYLFSSSSLNDIYLKIIENTMPYIYIWQWFNEENYGLSSENNPLLHGSIYKREFLELYNITFCHESSYSNEDVGFNHSCSIMLKNIALFDTTKYSLFIPKPIYYYIYDSNSLTHINNKEFLYKKQVFGLVKNIEHTILLGEQNNIDKKILWEEISAIMVRLYYDYSYILIKHPEYAPAALPYIQEFYFNYYKKYLHSDCTVLRATLGGYISQLIKLGVKQINFFKFLETLEHK